MSEIAGIDVLDRAQAALSSAQQGLRSALIREGSGETSVLPSAEAINAKLEKIPNVLNSLKVGLFSGDSADSSPSVPIIMSVYTLEDPAFRSFCACAGVLGTKLVFNSLWTVKNRATRKVFPTPEDIPAFGGTNPNTNDPVVERVRRMHLNDIENYSAFFILGLIYVATKPDPWEANIVFRSFVGARLGHTLTYLALEHQPGRFYCAAAGWAANLFMAVRVLSNVLF